MDPKFNGLIENLHQKYLHLIQMSPVKIDTLPKNTPQGGVYLFSIGGQHLYAGRTKKLIGDRVKDHVSKAPDCPFAWHLAREETGLKKASYKPEGSRKHLLSQPEFKAAYERAKQTIRTMEVRYVQETDPVKQALLEIYVAIVAGAKHNDFDTH